VNYSKIVFFWISREVVKESLEFIIKSFGGKVVWDGEGSIIKNEEDDSITHQIVDRGNVTYKNIKSRDYIQPQYVYDCVNAKVMLPTDKYTPGSKLPPHLSPFVDYEKEGYIPDYKKEIDNYFNKSIGIEVEKEKEEDKFENKKEEDESDDELDEERYTRELKAEKEGEKNTVKKKKRKRETKTEISKKEEEEQVKTSISLLPRKRRRLLQRIEYGERKKQGEIDKKEIKKKN